MSYMFSFVFVPLSSEPISAANRTKGCPRTLNCNSFVRFDPAAMRFDVHCSAPALCGSEVDLFSRRASDSTKGTETLSANMISRHIGPVSLSLLDNRLDK